jgi:hypothetical protein
MRSRCATPLRATCLSNRAGPACHHAPFDARKGAKTVPFANDIIIRGLPQCSREVAALGRGPLLVTLLDVVVGGWTGPREAASGHQW